MRRIAMFGIACLAATITAQATDREFRDVVAALSEEFHARPTHIPMFGLINMVTFVVRPAGAKHIDFAIFENLDTRDRDGRDLARSIRRAVGASWKPFVQVWSHHGGKDETTLVYMRMEGHDCRFLVTAIEPNEATVVELKLNPDTLQRWLVTPELSAQFSRRRNHRDRDDGN